MFGECTITSQDECLPITLKPENMNDCWKY